MDGDGARLQSNQICQPSLYNPIAYIILWKLLEKERGIGSFGLPYRAIKGRGFFSKNISWAYALWYLFPKIVNPRIVKIDKIQQNAPI